MPTKVGSSSWCSSASLKAPKNGAPSFHNKPSDRWRDVVRDFFSDSTGGQPYSEKHFKLDKHGDELEEGALGSIVPLDRDAELLHCTAVGARVAEVGDQVRES